MGLAWSARRLATGFQRANQEVIEISESSDTKRGMGTTLVAAYFDLTRSMLVLGHVGAAGAIGSATDVSSGLPRTTR